MVQHLCSKHAVPTAAGKLILVSRTLVAHHGQPAIEIEGVVCDYQGNVLRGGEVMTHKMSSESGTMELT